MGKSQATSRRLWIGLAKGLGIAVGSCLVVIVIWFEVAIAGNMLNDYRASIVRDTVAAIKEANVR